MLNGIDLLCIGCKSSLYILLVLFTFINTATSDDQGLHDYQYVQKKHIIYIMMNVWWTIVPLNIPYIFYRPIKYASIS